MKTAVLCAISAAMLLNFSGCALKPKVSYSGEEELHAKIDIRNGIGHFSWIDNESEAFKDALATAAQAALYKGYRYFSVIEPENLSSTEDISTLKAAKLLALCKPEYLMEYNFELAGEYGLHKCGTYNTRASLLIALYTKQPSSFGVYDAQEVMQYLHAENIVLKTEIEYLDSKQ